MTHEDLPRSPSGRREAAGDSDHQQGLPTPSDGLWGDRNGGLPRLSDCVARASRCAASPRPALLAENLGKPSSWIIIIAPWYRA